MGGVRKTREGSDRWGKEERRKTGRGQERGGGVKEGGVTGVRIGGVG